MHSSAMETACFAPTSLTIGATNRWEARGTISTSLRSGARRNGKTRPRLILRHHRTSGGIGTTSTATTKLPPGFSNRFAEDAKAAKRPGITRDRTPPQASRWKEQRRNQSELSEHYE